MSGSLDKELIRQVIQRNSGQIRFCYESLLNRFPKLGGKVAIRFTIASEGNVVTSTRGPVHRGQLRAGAVRGRPRPHLGLPQAQGRGLGGRHLPVHLQGGRRVVSAEQ